MKIFTAEQMREFDRVAVERYEIPSIVLMENAALRVVEFLEMKFAPLEDKRVVVLCGKGNNGGDGFSIARHLVAVGCNLHVILVAASNEIQGDALVNLTILRESVEAANGCDDANLLEVNDSLKDEGAPYRAQLADSKIADCDIIVDCLLGTGFSGEVRGERLRHVLYGLRSASGFSTHYSVSYNPAAPRRAAVRIAVDMPSAVNADNGQAAVEAGPCDYTVTFAAPKRGLFVSDGVRLAGEIWVGDIGTLPIQMFAPEIHCECITRELARALLPHRSLDAHKGSAGRAVVIGGSFGMSGAPTLASRAVLRSGAGLCIACLPDKVLSTFASAFSEATSHPLPCDADGRLIPEAADELPNIWEGAQVVAIGPGISRGQSTLQFVRRVVRECPLPLVIDADALYALREVEDEVKARTAPTILTPHPGEMGELMQIETSAINDDRFGISLACAEKYGAIVLLKGARSIVAIPNFKTCREQITGAAFVNLTGNPGMATGGSGDVLTGTIAGLLAQTQDAQTATLLGVYVHGLAGDLCFETKGNGLIAGDLADALPQALLEIAKPLEVPPNARLRKLQ